MHNEYDVNCKTFCYLDGVMIINQSLDVVESSGRHDKKT